MSRAGPSNAPSGSWLCLDDVPTGSWRYRSRVSAMSLPSPGDAPGESRRCPDRVLAMPRAGLDVVSVGSWRYHYWVPVMSRRYPGLVSAVSRAGLGDVLVGFRRCLGHVLEESRPSLDDVPAGSGDVSVRSWEVTTESRRCPSWVLVRSRVSFGDIPVGSLRCPRRCPRRVSTMSQSGLSDVMTGS